MVADDTTLAQLLGRAQSGDGAAYETLLRHSKAWLTRYFSRRIQPDALDDLVQDTLMSLHRKRASFDPSRPYLPWLAAIARYRWVDHLRRVYRANETALDTDAATDSGEDEIAARISIDRLLTLIPPGQAAAIRLVKIDGLSIAEAAARCGQSESLVKVNVHRGIKKLNALIEND